MAIMVDYVVLLNSATGNYLIRKRLSVKGEIVHTKDIYKGLSKDYAYGLCNMLNTLEPYKVEKL